MCDDFKGYTELNASVQVQNKLENILMQWLRDAVSPEVHSVLPKLPSHYL